jgi:HEAT repeat protein
VRAILFLLLGIILSGCDTPMSRNEPALGSGRLIQLAERLADDDPEVRFQARLALMSKGRPAVPFLAAGLQGRNPVVWYEAASALCGMRRVPRKEAVPGLVRVVQAGDGPTRHIAVQALGSIGPDAREAGPVLLEMLRNEKAPLGPQAARALARIQGSAAVPALVEALQSPHTRIEALYALGELGPRAKEVIPDIETFLRDKDSRARAVAARTLQRIRGPE